MSGLGWRNKWELYGFWRRRDKVFAKLNSRKLWATVAGAALTALGSELGMSEDTTTKIVALIGAYVLGQAFVDGKATTVKIIALLLLIPLGTARAQDTPPAISIEGGVASFVNPQAQFGMLLGGGATRSYSRFAYQSDGTARQVETGVERVILTHPRFSIVSRALAGIAQNESNTSGTVAGQFGFVVPIRWGFHFVAVGEAGNSPIREGEWRGNPLLLIRWRP